MTVGISGPSGGQNGQLAAGATGTFSIKIDAACPNPTCRAGIDVASADNTLSVADSNFTQLVGNEITHKSPTKTVAGPNGSATYTFNFTVPANATPGSAHKLYGISHVEYSTWQWTTDFNVVVPIGTAGPTTDNGSTHHVDGVSLKWTGGNTPKYRIAYASGSTYPTQPKNGQYTTANTSYDVVALTSSTMYSFSIWGMSEKSPGPEGGNADPLFSSNVLHIQLTTDAPPPPNQDPSLQRTGSLLTGRFGHTATLLPNGKVLVAGGQNSGAVFFASAELYDPVTGTFSPTGSMTKARSGHTATLLTNGKVLIAGGASDLSPVAELYDPVAGTFTTTGSMAGSRSGHTANLLQNGKVLVAGGTTSLAADLYDPSNGTFSPTGSMTSARFSHTATLLPNGKVLLAGGSATAGGAAIGTAELYTPSSNTFASTSGTMTSPRKNHTATLEADGANVVFVGGINGSELLTMEVFDVSGGFFWTPFDPPNGRYATANHTATLMPSGEIFVTGGTTSGTSVNKTERAQSVGAFPTGKLLADPRSSHTATLLINNRVLIVGGKDSSGTELTTAELYVDQAVAGGFDVGNTLLSARSLHSATLLPNGNVLIAGGYTGADMTTSAELYPAHAYTTGSMAQKRGSHTATLLTNGKVLIAGGYADTILSSCELFDPAAGTFSNPGPMTTPRVRHTATLLANGKVLLAGGEGNSGVLASAELYDPVSSTFTATGNMTTARTRHTATLLMNGKVLIAGGSNTTVGDSIASAELYDPNTGTFTSTGGMGSARDRHTATLLPDGRVLVADGSFSVSGVSGGLSSSEVYDPAFGAFSTGTCCSAARYGASATLLPDGRLVIAGGANGTGVTGVEIYDFATNATATVGTITGREGQTGTLLTDGSILYTGGTGSGGTTLNSMAFAVPNTYCGDNCNSRQPLVTSAPTAFNQPSPITLGGTRFRGKSEGSSGTTRDSSADFPYVQLQRIDNEQIAIVRPVSFTDTSYTSVPVSGLPDGHYRVTMITNGVASASSVLAIVTVQLIAPTITATATTTTTVGISWNTVIGAATYEVARSTNGSTYTTVGTTANTAITDAASANTAYLYVVRAVDSSNNVGPYSSPDLATTVIFTDDPAVAGSTVIKAVHISQLRTAIDALRTLAGLGAGTYADSIVAGTTQIKASHITELRTALNPARAALGLPAITYTDPTLSSGISVKAAHVNQLRSGVK